MLKAEINEILLQTSNIHNPENTQLSLFSKFDDSHLASDFKGKGDYQYLKKWDAPRALDELLAFRNRIQNYQNKDILKIILSRAARSARLTTHFDLDFPESPQIEPYHCYKHGRICSPVQEAFKFLSRYGLDTIRRVEHFAHLRTEAAIDVIHGDSRFANPGRIDGVITIPPYVGLIDYHEQHGYSYALLGLEDRSAEEIGPAFEE